MGHPVQLTYCTNVHSMPDYDSWKKEIGFFGPQVRSELSWEFLNMGLWFQAELAHGVIWNKEHGALKLKEFLAENKLGVFTLNAFPFGNFHDEVVKKNVYLPDWCDISRVQYTLNCAKLLSHLLSDGNDYGSISTLPLGWRTGFNDEKMIKAAENLLEVSQELEQLHQNTGKQIRICIEPEPGCALEFTPQVVEFWDKYLRPAAEKKFGKNFPLTNYLGLCYDTCHQAVQFENSAESLDLLMNNEIPIGKIQLSNALEFFPEEMNLAKKQRESFCEKKFLHQTRIMGNEGLICFDDLNEAMETQVSNYDYPWRTHYHVPLMYSTMADSQKIGNTILEMFKAIDYVIKYGLCSHFEVETYTWTVLPEHIRPKNKTDLAKSLAAEIRMVDDYFHKTAEEK